MQQVEMERVRETRSDREREQDGKMERRIRMAMAAKVDSQGNCVYCGRSLVKDVFGWERDDIGSEDRAMGMDADGDDDDGDWE